MPTIYVRRELYDKIIRMDENAKEFVNEAVEEKIKSVKEGDGK